MKAAKMCCATVLLIGPALLPMVGCQTTVGGQTLPSAYYLDDDVQFHPAGGEFRLPNAAAQLEEYRSQRQAAQEKLGDVSP